MITEKIETNNWKENGYSSPRHHYYWHFRSYPEFLAECKSTHGSSHTNEDSWTGGASYPQAVQLAQTGWPEGTAKVKKFSGELIEEIKSQIVRDEIVYDVEGVDFDLPRVLEGEPEAWIKFEENHTVGNTGRKIIKLVFNGAANCNVSSSEMIAKGAAAAALIELLELAGHRVEVILSYGVYENGNYFFPRITIKEPDQFLDIDKLAFTLAHPAAFRRLYFSFAESRPDDLPDKMGVGSGYGSTTNMLDKDRGDIYIPGGDLGFDENELKKAENWILKNLSSQGVQIKMKEKSNP